MSTTPNMHLTLMDRGVQNWDTILNDNFSLIDQYLGAGTPGPPGITGPVGSTGPQGPQGDTGPEGPTGATGPQGVQGDPGQSGITWAGAWDSGTTYAQGEGVSHGGDLYISLSDGNTNHEPPNATWWVTTGAMGPQGPAGPTGATGPTGPQGATGATGPQGDPGPTAFADVVQVAEEITSGTVYQNNSASPMFISAWTSTGGEYTSLIGVMGPTSVPTNTIFSVNQSAGKVYGCMIVPPYWYWKITSNRPSQAPPTISSVR